MIIYKTFRTVGAMKNFLMDTKEIAKAKRKYPPSKYALLLNEIDIQLEIIERDQTEGSLG